MTHWRKAGGEKAWTKTKRRAKYPPAKELLMISRNPMVQVPWIGKTLFEFFGHYGELQLGLG